MVDMKGLKDSEIINEEKNLVRNCEINGLSSDKTKKNSVRNF